MLKMTSLVSVIALSDLLYSVQLIYSRNYQTLPLLLVACFWYLVATTALSGVQRLVESRFGKGLGAR
ncbi:polar amino acid ABC transporter inner membrane protein [Mycobacterium tuberculosis]|nr:polar amino acid ABC transporter inner membrane protein [Mycobacterium tuberculosis]